MGDLIYFTNIGPKSGPILYRDSHLYGGIGVLESRDNHHPVGMAFRATWDDQGRALWRLNVNKTELPGLWVVVDREFVRVQ
jgi:hypothetical protein